MDYNKNGKVCPLLLDPLNYEPDTIDLSNNQQERNYWLPCLEEMVKKFVKKASILNPDSSTATERAEACYQKFHRLIEKLMQDPKILKPLSVRTLLEYNEENLRENNFKDAWYLQKEKESLAALLEFKDRINYIDSISDFNEKWLELSNGVLAGNVFDWGARAVTDILELKDDFSLKQAMNTIEKRPWFHDDLDLWINKIKKKPYELVVIFVDNGGVDFILGMLPLVREFLLNGTQVILTANSKPALNDVTFRELKIYTCKASQSCAVLKDALISGHLVMVENGQKSPCLDLSNLTTELCTMMRSADLIILEGMGRAVHTNFKAKFKVDSLKLAVLKNEWLAKSLGAQQFSVIFKYEPAAS